MSFLTLPERTQKPRETGITHVLVKSRFQAREIAEYTDIAKFGWGLGYLSSLLGRSKGPPYNQVFETAVTGIKALNMRPCCGGTLFELAHLQGKIAEYARWLNGFDIDLIEVSNGTVDIPTEEMVGYIEEFSEWGFTVLAEVGKKEDFYGPRCSEWADQTWSYLEAGAWKAILEARESGSVGIWNEEWGWERREKVVSAVGQGHLIFEAPLRHQQVQLVKEFGPNVNLGNIAPHDVLPLETLRLGLRSDTLLHFHQEGGIG